VGRISRHRYAMNHRPDPARRESEIESYHEAVERVTAKHQQVLADIKANTPTFREKQIAYNKARGAYESRTFLESTLRMKGIDPAADIEDMKTQYEEWKRDVLGVPLPSTGAVLVTLKESVGAQWAESVPSDATDPLKAHQTTIFGWKGFRMNP